MKTKIGLTLCLSVLIASQSFAESPIPTFDKDAVTVHPYNRTGQQEVEIDKDAVEKQYQSGNTGTEQDLAFYVRKINLTGKPLQDKEGKLTDILKKYTHRDVKVSELGMLQQELTEYCKIIGYTVPLVVVPPQEIKNGELEVKIYLASYDKISLKQNESDVADKVLASYIKHLPEG